MTTDDAHGRRLLQLRRAPAAPSVFSAERAMDDLRAVASRPPSIGTAGSETTIATIRSRLQPEFGRPPVS